MKCLTLFSLMVISILLASCKNEPAKKPDSTGFDIQRYLVDAATVQRDIERYDEISRKIFKDSLPIKYYTVRAIDLMAAMDVKDTSCTYHYVRVNLALDSNYKFKLYVQPVIDALISPEEPDKNTAGIGYFFNEKGDIISANSPGTKFLADLNAPCPNTCGH